MLSRRVASAAAGIPLLLGATYVGGWPLGALVSILALAAIRETVSLLGSPRGAGVRSWVWAWAWAAVAPWVALARPAWLLPAWAGVSLLFLARQGLSAARARGTVDLERLGRETPASLFALFYPTILIAHLVLLRAAGPAGEVPYAAAWAVLFLVWANDTVSYFAGRALGGPCLAPAVSPGKTVTGGVGGLVAAGAVGAWVGPGMLGLTAGLGAGFGALVGVAAQVGDLFESLLKRTAGVKDSGRLIPGHGGVLDRFDSLVFALPLSYYLLMYLST